MSPCMLILGPDPTPPVGEADSNQQVASIVGGVVGSIVGLSCLIVGAVAFGVAVCCVSRRRRKKKEQWYV